MTMPETTQSDLVERLEAWSDNDAEYGHHARSQALAQAAAEIKKLVATLAKVRRSALSLTETQRQIYDHYQAASKINAEAVGTLDSERAANALLTEENDRLRAHCEAMSNALEAIKGEVERTNGNLVHLRRCVSVQCKAGLAAYRKEGGA